jgi:hypothetical protein
MAAHRSLINYYEILGLQYGAGIAEIKASFRHLAKLYHPDINPDGKEDFTKILRAYETLSDPVLKSSYDYKLNYHQAQTQRQTKKTDTKTWRFDERELKRRQYYNDHIKKYAKETASAPAEGKKNYNEFKYILFATPLAVILFLLIMSLSSHHDKHTGPANASHIQETASLSGNEGSGLKMGDAPYTLEFGGAKYDTSHHQTLTVKNLTGTDVIVCLFTETDFVRSFYIERNYSAEVSQLPVEPLYINYSSGKDFDDNKYLESAGITGAFTTDLLFFRSIRATAFNPINELTLVPGDNEGFVRTDETEFFKRANDHDKKN